MKASRRHQRFIRRLQTEFSANSQNYIGISSDFSEGGLFVRTTHAFAPGTLVDLLIHLPDGNQARLKGSVRRALKTPLVALKNGMGIELVEKDSNYIEFIRSFSPDERDATPAGQQHEAKPDVSGPQAGQTAAPAFMIVACTECRVKNKVNRLKLSLGPRCGRCGKALIID